MSYRRNTSPSIFDVFSLNPLPYPVILLMAVIFFFLGLQWYVSYESIVETAEESMGWLLMAAPLLLLFAVRWLSTLDNPGWWFYGASSPWDRRRRNNYFGSAAAAEGGSPWGWAALILLVLLLLQYQSVFLKVGLYEEIWIFCYLIFFPYFFSCQIKFKVFSFGLVCFNF
ncbi:hypothetical protein PHJA_000738800 [Phtheirospermum japonicum]|uniref:Uncharacterized protein n=1 Tax=Phtheirospermum japonicum TaxID=374723 RepID=A0A830BED3_9LAMI|nr:hypothetical protein PHJA_000738800 [Phtheirospermum japonicum]